MGGAPSPHDLSGAHHTGTLTAAQGGKPFNLSLKQALKKGPVVLYFFPAAFTPGCTLEAHLFAEDLRGLGDRTAAWWCDRRDGSLHRQVQRGAAQAPPDYPSPGPGGD